jgi:homoserine dehydrogenase
MSGTPVLAALTGGLGGATPVRLRGVLNATVNRICTDLAEGTTYDDALAAAQRAGLAEADPAADVDGLDSAAKVMILAALVFGVQIEPADVRRRGISAFSAEEIAGALGRGERVREVSAVDPDGGRYAVEAVAVARSDPLFGLEGTDNVVTLEAEPIGEVSIRGPGAGPELAGQGAFSDLIALAAERAARA